MDSFSWTDNFRAAVGTCLPCFAPSGRSSSDSEDEASRTGAIGRQTRFDELEGLLGDTDDADTMSLHSNIGQSQQHRRRKRRARKNIQFFGFNLFGRPPIQLPDSDDEDSVDSSRRCLGLGLNMSAHSSSSGSAFDEDAAPLDPADISRLTAQDAAARAENLDRIRRTEEQRRMEEREEREERRRRRKERKELKRVAYAIAHGAAMNMDGEEFEGFQGSGEFASPTSLPAMHSSMYVPSVPIEEFGPYVGGAIPSIGPSDDPADADFGAEVYLRKQRAHGSDSSRSQTRSRSSASQSNVGSSQGYNHHFISPPSPVGHAQSSSTPGIPMAAAPERKRKNKKIQSISHVSSPPTSQSASLPSLDSPTATTPTLSETHIVSGDGKAYSPLYESSASFAAMQADKFPIVGFGGMRRMDNAGSTAFLANRGDA